MKRTWYAMTAQDDGSAQIDIHDEIGFWGVTFSDFIRDLKALGPVDRITVSLNSPGGEITDGLAIYNALRNHAASVTTRVEGLAASMASIVFMAGDRREMPDNAFLMIHNPWGGVVGESEDLRKYADLLDKMRGTLANIYTERGGVDPDAVSELMDEETWMTGAEAIALGFATDLTAPVKMAARFDIARLNMSQAPDALKNSLTENAPAEADPLAEVVEQPDAATPEKVEPESAPADESPEPADAVEQDNKPKLSALQRLLAKVGGDDKAKARVTELESTVGTLNAELETLRAKVADLEPKATQLAFIEAELAKLEAEAVTAEAKAAEIVAQSGFEAENLPPVSASDATTDESILDQFNGLSGEERTKFFKENRAAIRRAQRNL